MIVPASPWLASLAPRVRQVVLILAALFVAHDAIYLARFGIGRGYAEAMSASGHDAYWAPVSIFLAAGVATLALTSVATYRRLRREDHGEPVPGAGPSYAVELGAIWIRLFPTVAFLFTVQENVEHFAVDGHLVGIAPLLGPGSALALPALAATTFALAAVGGMVRWRIRGLQARIAATSRPRFARVRGATRPRGWDILAATVAHRWITGRPDAGRAPPVLLTRSVTTA
jgi:hypothetical protein